jgi:2'-5' RNA ligase
LWPDAPALEALQSAAHAGVVVCGGRRMRPDSLHMTLAFIGAVSATQIDALRAAAAGVRAAPFEVVLDRLGFWQHNRIFWAGGEASPSRQHRLWGELHNVLTGAGFPQEAHPWFPHVTLARDAHCASVPTLPEPIRWQAREFTLVESSLQPSGARYRVLGRWPLSENA